MEWLKRIVLAMIEKRFYGRITVYFEDGKIVRAVKEESLKPN